MAWIESHENLGEHPKLHELCVLLNIDKPTAIGILHLLWHFTLKFAWRDGDLSKFTKEAISSAIYWKGDANALFLALQSCGWLDEMVVHDWFEYAGKLVKDRHYNEKRKRRKTPLNVVRRRKSAATVPNLTVPNLTKDTQTSPQPEIPATPEKLVELWNQAAHENLPRVKELTPIRKTHIKARLSHHPEKQFWISIIQKINNSKFLRGDGPSRENGSPWRADFDWVMNQTNLVKILEGNYDNR